MSNDNIPKMTRVEFNAFCMSLIAHGKFRQAARFMWPWFKQNDWTDKIWNALQKYPRLCIMGHGSASKTFTASIWFLLDWIAHADKTALILTSSTVPAMDGRIWADFKTLWSKSRLPLTTFAQIMESKRMIRMSINEGKAAVHALAAESDGAETKIQGMHMPRNRVIIDEADNPYSSSIWPALVNLGTSGDLRAVALANPVDKNSEFGFHCEPVNGWDSIDPESDSEWESKLGWHVLRLDGLKSPNIVAGEDRHPYLLSNSSVNETRDHKGPLSPEWWTMIRAWYPPEGLVSSIFPSGLLGRCEKPILWYAETQPVAACDPAFEGGDNCSLMLGKIGRFAHQPERTGLEVNEYHNIKRKDLSVPLGFDYARQIVDLLKARGVKGKNFGIDTTGNQGSFADIIESMLGEKIMRVNFGGSASETRIVAEDTLTAKQRFKNFVTELWYAAREWCRLGLVYVVNPPRDLRIQLEARRYELKGKDVKSGREVIQAEPKGDMKARGLHSPDCFIAGTMILTDKGEIPIDKIRAGCMIKTPFGSSPVIHVHVSETKSLSHVRFTNGQSLCGKGAHKVFTWDKGWTRLDALSLTNHIESDYNLPLWNILNLLFTTVKSSTFKQLVDTIHVVKGRREFYTESSGRNTMGLFLMALKSIISMVIGLIIELKIFLSWKEKSMEECTCSKDSKTQNSGEGIWRTSARPFLRLLSGIDRKRDGHGTEFTEKNAGSKKRSIPASASFARRSLNPISKEQSSAQGNAVKGIPCLVSGLIEFAWFVTLNFLFSNTAQRKVAPLNVQVFSCEKPSLVYNLTLREHNVYYANRILVQNCGDAFSLIVHVARQLSIGFTPGTFKDTTPTQSLAKFRKNATVWTQDYGVPQ